MKKISLVLSFFLLLAGNATSQDLPGAMTGASLQQFVNATIDKLTNAGTILMGNGSIVIGGAANEVSGLLNQFNGMIKDDITKPILGLSSDIRNLASQLYSIADRLNVILNQQQSCIVLNSQTVLAGVQTIVSEIKIIGIPVISTNAAHLNYFQFDGHSASVVPQSGGRIRILGSKLWQNNNLPPGVLVLSGDRTDTILKPKPERSQDNNSFSFSITPQLIQKYAGQCLQIRVEPREREWFSAKSMGMFYMPLCIPSSFNSLLKVVAYMQYPCSVTNETTLDFRNFSFGNHSCENNIDVSHTECWDLKGGTILHCEVNGLTSVNNNNVQVNFQGNCITASGSLDRASCVRTFVSATLQHDADWGAMIAPHISYTTVQQNQSDGQSAFTQALIPVTAFCVGLDNTCGSTAGNTFWFEVIRTTGIETTTIYTSPHISATNFADDINGFSVEATLNPTPVNGKAQVCVKITQAQCGF